MPALKAPSRDLVEEVGGSTTTPQPTKRYDDLTAGNDLDSAEVRLVSSERSSWTADGGGNLFQDIEEFFHYAPKMQADWTGRAEAESDEFPETDWEY